MAPAPLPPTMPAWAKWVMQNGPAIAAGLQEVLDFIGSMGNIDETAPGAWRRAQYIFELVGNVDPADKWVTTMDFVNYTNGSLDESWTAQDYTDIESAISPFVTALALKLPNSVKWSESRYYVMNFTAVDSQPPGAPDKPFAPSGPPDRIFTHTTVGAVNGGLQAPQVAMTSTDKGVYPRHWGRNYWPGLSSGSVTPTGHLIPADVDAIGTALATAYATLYAKQLLPTIVTTQIQGARARVLQGVTHIAVDDVPDVVRRRRPHTTLHRYTN